MANINKTGIISEVSGPFEWEDPRSGQVKDLFSFQIEGDGRWFRTGEEQLWLDEGTAIRFSFNSKSNQVDLDTVKEIDPSEVEDDAPPKRRSGSSGNGGRNSRRSRGARSTGTRSGSSTKPTAQKEDWNARTKYWDDKAKRDVEVVEPRITFSAAQRDAVSIVTAALANDGLSFGNAAKGKRLDMLLDMVDQVAYRFYDQRINGEFTEDSVVRTTQKEDVAYGEE